MIEERQNRTAAARLEAVVRLFALPGAAALARAGLTSPDALAIEFDEVYTAFVGNLDELPSGDQLSALQELDAQLLEMSDPAHRSLWTAEAMAENPAWDSLQRIARLVLIAFSWNADGNSGEGTSAGD